MICPKQANVNLKFTTEIKSLWKYSKNEKSFAAMSLPITNNKQ